MLDIIKALDMKIDLFLQNFQNPVFDFIATVFHFIGEKGIVFILIGLFFIIFKKFRHVGVCIVLAQGLNGVTVEVLKQFFSRARPFVVDPSIVPLFQESPLKSFPSGHASAAFAFAIVVGYFFPKTNKYMIAFAVIMCISRLYAFVHFPTDVIVGAIIGTLSAYICIYITRRFFSKRRFK